MQKNKNTNARKDSGISSSLTILGVIVVFGICLGLFKKNYLTLDNFAVIANSFSITALVGLSQMVIIAAGGMNLSVGALGGLAGIITGMFMDALGMPTVVAIFAGLIVGLICGLLNGLLIVRAGARGPASFLVTLATASVFRGIIQGVTNATPFYNLNEDFLSIGNTELLRVPLLMWIMVVFTVLMGLMFRYTSLGRRLLAVGGNIRAAELYGVPVRHVVIMSNMLSGLFASIAGILLVSRLGSAQPDIGSDWMLFSFAAPLIGGSRLAGGKINAFGTVLGAVLLAAISNALIHLNLDIYWMTFIQGVIILGAVAIERARQVSFERVQRKEREAI